MAIDFDPTLPEGQERQGILKPLQEGNLAGAARGLGQMFLPTFGMEGQRSLSDIFAGFVEYTKIGDFGDLLAGLDPNADLDPIERGLAILGFGSVAGISGYGVKSGLNRMAKRQVAPAPTPEAELSMFGPDGGYYIPAEKEYSLENTPPPRVDPETARKHQAQMERVRLESQSPWSKEVLAADNWEQIGAASGMSPGRAWSVGRAVVALSRKPEMYGADPEIRELVAAKVAITRYKRAYDLGLVQVERDGQLISPSSIPDMADAPTNQDAQFAHIVALENAMGAVIGPDLALDPGARIGKIVLHSYDRNRPPGATVYVGLVDELLPSERVWDHDRLMPLDEARIQVRIAASDWEATEGIRGSNHLRMLVEQSYQPDGTWASESTEWYSRFNKSAEVMAEATGLTVAQTANVIATLSANSPWHHNLSSAIHTLLQLKRPDLQVGSPEYQQVFRDATLGAGWGPELYQYSGKDVQKLIGAEGDFGPIADHYANPESLRGPSGFLAATDADKLEKVDLILNSGLPPWIAMRMMKTNTFGQQGTAPFLQRIADLVTIDRHSTNAAWGSVFIGKVLAHQGVKAGKLDPDGIYTDPVSGQSVTGREIIERLDAMKEHGWTQAQVDRWKKLVVKMPNERAMARFLSEARAMLIARDEAGLDAGHQAQAGGWAGAQAMDRAGTTRAYNRIAESGSLKEIREVTRQATTDPTLVSGMEGNPTYGTTAAGFLWNVSDDLSGPLPTSALLDDAVAHMAREASNARDFNSSIVYATDQAGKAMVYVRRDRQNRPGIQAALRHLTPSGIVVGGKWERWVPSAAKELPSVADHYKTLVDQTREDGSPIAAIAQMAALPQGVEHPGIGPGTRLAVTVGHGMETEVKLRGGQFVHGGFTEFDVSESRTAAARSHIDVTYLEGMTDEQFTETLGTVDWYTIASDDVDTLRKDVAKIGGSGFQIFGEWRGADGTMHSDDGLFITGISPEQAYQLGAKHNQESIVGRFGLLYTTDAVDSATGEVTRAGTLYPADGTYRLDDQKDPDAYTTIPYLKRQFTANIDFEQPRVFSPSDPISVGETLKLGLSSGGPRRTFVFDFGGEQGGMLLNWNNLDRATKAMASIPGASVRLYTNAANHVPAGWAQATESIHRDQAGVVGSVLTTGGDPLAPHQVPVFVPEQTAAGLDAKGFGAERLVRPPLEARQIMRIEDGAGQIWFDHDVVLQFDPEATVTIPDKGPIVKGLRVSQDGGRGRKVRTLGVDLRGPVPVIQLNADPAPQPGLFVVDLNENGRVTDLGAVSGENWLPAVHALARAGLFADVNKMNLWHPAPGPAMVRGEAVEIDIDQADRLPESVVGAQLEAARTDADHAAFDSLTSAGLNVKLVSFGAVAEQHVVDQTVNVIEDLAAGTGRFAEAAKLVGFPPASIWNEAVLAVGKFPEQTVSDGKFSKQVPHRGVAATVHGGSGVDGIYLSADIVSYAFNTGYVPGRTDTVKVPGTSYLETTVIHEVGHLLASTVDSYEVDYLIDNGLEGVGGYRGAMTVISRYAGIGMKPGEFFAEAFTKVMLDPHGAHPSLVNMVRSVIELAERSGK